MRSNGPVMSDDFNFDELSFTVFGEPVPQGSARAFVPKGWTRAIITAANSKTKPWRQQFAGTARVAMLESGFDPIMEGPVFVRLEFYFDKPKSVRKSLEHKCTRPDADKLVRLAGDSMTGIVFKDDCQIVDLEVIKRYGSPARTEVKIGRVPFGVA